jgi:predicted NBD/HSP70 family sugar kinase
MEVLGIDVGGSGIKGAPVDTKTGKLLAERIRIKTPKTRSLSQSLKSWMKSSNPSTGRNLQASASPRLSRQALP